MSFIRCLSNPEALYIWDDVGGFISIVAPNQYRQIIEVKRKDWYKLLKGFVDGDYYIGSKEIKVGSLSVREKIIPIGPKKIKYFRDSLSGKKRAANFGTADRKVELSIRTPRKIYRIPMWAVTWYYIVSHVRCPYPDGHGKIVRRTLKMRKRAYKLGK